MAVKIFETPEVPEKVNSVFFKIEAIVLWSKFGLSDC
jgi:hypothetical protein